ncbi:MAG: TetR/AcrR family transcriptional regulator [Paludibacteraceae bacterium]|nr:TetR/AcrR family transcriptional regulator [Paludibacteraceae bacterium]
MRDNKTEKIILQAAEEEFLLKGFAGARTTEIAQKAGVNHAMLHYYFNTKEQLFEQVMTDKITLFRDSVASVFEQSDLPVLQQIMEAMSRHFDFVRQNPLLPRFILNEISVRPEYIENIKSKLLPLASNIFSKLQHSLDEAFARGEICQINALTLMLDIVSLNLFVFIAHPIITQMQSVLGDLDTFYEARKQENINIIVNRLKNNIPCNEKYY